MNVKHNRSLCWLSLSGLIVLLDQITKWLALSKLGYADPVPVLPFLNWTLLYNRGMAFSLFNEGGWQAWVLGALTVIVTIVLLGWLFRTPRRHHWQCAALALVIGGAVGNLIDRIRFGYVVDFVDVYYQQWHWPAFNVADSAITIGAILLAIVLFRQEQ